MSVTNEQFVSEYLERINYHGSTTPCLETLIDLQRCHQYAVPYENLELLKDNFMPNLDREYLFDKIVRQRRGGICHEMNTSFYNLLVAMGFDAQQIGGGSFLDRPMNGHAITLVHLPEGDYTADVGYGDDAIPPLNLTTREPVEAYHAKAWVEDAEDGSIHLYLQRPGKEPAFQYRFCTKVCTSDDFMPAFLETAEKGAMFFSTDYFCCRFNPKGKILFLRGVLTVEEYNQIVEKRTIAPGEESERVLREYFDLP